MNRVLAEGDDGKSWLAFLSFIYLPSLVGKVSGFFKRSGLMVGLLVSRARTPDLATSTFHARCGVLDTEEFV